MRVAQAQGRVRYSGDVWKVRENFQNLFIYFAPIPSRGWNQNVQIESTNNNPPCTTQSTQQERRTWISRRTVFFVHHNTHIQKNKKKTIQSPSIQGNHQDPISDPAALVDSSLFRCVGLAHNQILVVQFVGGVRRSYGPVSDLSISQRHLFLHRGILGLLFPVFLFQTCKSPADDGKTKHTTQRSQSAARKSNGTGQSHTKIQRWSAVPKLNTTGQFDWNVKASHVGCNENLHRNTGQYTRV